MGQVECPTSEVLCRLASASLPDDAAAAVLAHVEDCGYCRQIVDSLGQMVRGGTLGSEDQKVIESVVQKVTGDELRETVIGDSDEAEIDAAPPEGHILLSSLDSEGSVDRYTLTRLHASGGMGRVWLARDASIGRDVALKELLPERSDHPHVWARFLNEARVTGRLEHPGIVPVYEVSEQADTKPFYTMRFVKGQTLHDAAVRFQTQRAEETASLRLRELITSLVGVCNAVAYAHSRGVLHRDLKGRNIVLGDFGEVVVLDWGLASAFVAADSTEKTAFETDARGHSVDGQVVGTPRFMAPEQADADRAKLSPATDVYGLGAVLYEILTGGPPIDGDSSEEILQNVLTAPPQPPREKWAEVPRALNAICLKALSKRPADRYATPLEMADDLHRWMADEAVTAYRDPWSSRLARWARNHRTLVTSTAILLITAVTALTISTIAIAGEQAQTQLARERAERNLQRARAAVDTMLTRVGDERLRNVPQMELLRRTLLEEAVRFHEEILDESDAPEHRREAALTHRRLAGIYEMLGQTDDATESLNKADGLLQQLSNDDEQARYQQTEIKAIRARLLLTRGDNIRAEEQARAAIDSFGTFRRSAADITSEQRRTIAGTWLLLAETQRLSRHMASAEESLRSAIQLFSDNPTDPVARLSEADARTRLADLLMVESRLDEADAEYKIATNLGRQLLKEDAANADVAESVARTIRQYAALLKLSDRRAESLQLLAESLPIHERLATDFPHLPGSRQALTECLSQLAPLYATTGERDRAGLMFVKAHEQANSLADDFPDLVELQFSAAESAQALGAFHAAERRDSDAQEVLAAATDRIRSLPDNLRTTPEIQGRLGTLVNTYAELATRNELYDLALKLSEEYVAILESLVARPNPTAAIRNELAQGYRSLSTTHAEVNHSEQAAEWLSKAVEAHRELAADYPDIGEYRRQLGFALTGKARQLLQSGSLEEARVLHKESQQLRQTLHNQQPDWVAAQSDLAEGHRVMASILQAKKEWHAADRELDIAAELLNQLAERDSVSDLFNQQALVLLARTDLLLDQDKKAEAIAPLDEAIQIYRDEHETRPDLKHAQRGLYRFLRRKADIRIRQEEYGSAKALILEAEQLTLDQEWGNPYEIALLICRNMQLITKSDSIGAAQRELEQRSMAELAMKNLRSAIEFDCPAEEVLDILPELETLKILPEYDGFIRQLEAARNPNRLWKHADDPAVLKPKR